MAGADVHVNENSDWSPLRSRLQLPFLRQQIQPHVVRVVAEFKPVRLNVENRDALRAVGFDAGFERHDRENARRIPLVQMPHRKLPAEEWPTSMSGAWRISS